MAEDTIYVDESGRQVAPPQQAQGFSYPPIPQSRQDKADILDKIRPDLIVEVIRHKLMGEELINGKWEIQQHLQSRALTPVGAWDIANLMLPVSSQNVSISKLQDHEIRSRALSIAKTAQRMCLDNWIDYGITKTDQLWFVHEIVFSNTLITLKQPEGAGIRELIKGTTTEQRSVVSQDDRKSRGGLFFRR